jgi:hypothetical protein
MELPRHSLMPCSLVLPTLKVGSLKRETLIFMLTQSISKDCRVVCRRLMP